MTEKRPQRICDVCSQIDDHPRHVHVEVGIPVNQASIKALAESGLTGDEYDTILADILDTTTQQRHMDCCRSVGCPDGTCDAIGKTGAQDLRGSALLKHLTSGKVDAIGSDLTAARNAAASQEG